MANATAPLALAVGAPLPSAAKYTDRSKYLAEALKGMQAGSTNIRSGGELATRLLAQAITGYAQRKNDEKLHAAQTADQQAQQAYVRQQIASAFPNDPRAQALASLNPEAVIAAAAKGYEPQTLSSGQTLVQGGAPVYQAPIIEKFDDRFGRYDPTTNSVSYTQARGPTFQENEGQRHNQVGEAQGWRGLDINQQNANSQATSAGAAATGAQTGRLAYEARKAAGGFGTPGVGGVLGPNLDPNEWEFPGAAGR